MSPEIMAGLASHKPGLLAMLASPTKPAPKPELPYWTAPNLSAEDSAAVDAILAWPLDDRTSWTEMIESGRRHNEAVLSRPAAKEQTPESPVSIPDSLQLTLFK
jgi:hypothetical protein